MIKYLPYIVYLLLIGLHQIILKDLTSIAGITINLPALLVCLFAIYKSDIQSAWFGFLAGLALSPGEPSLIGEQALALSALGLAAFHARLKLNLDSILSKISLVAAGVMLHSSVSLLLPIKAGFFFRLWSDAFPEALYTSLLGWLFFMYKDGRLSLKKLKSIF